MTAAVLQFGAALMPQPQRVAETPRKHSYGMTDDRVEFHMWNWEQWQYRQRAQYGRGFPTRGLSGMGTSGSSDLDAMIEHADARCAKAVEAILNGLAPVYRMAVHAKHLQAVYRTRMPLDMAYRVALDAVRKGLSARGIV